MRIFFLGYPGGMGGANTECLHLVKLWRGAGWDVTLIPTWGKPQPGKNKSRDELDRLGCTTAFSQNKAAGLADIPELPGSIVVVMCNEHLASSMKPLRELGCKVVWVNCMTFAFPWEGVVFRDREAGPPDACVYQSNFQREKLGAVHEAMGCDSERMFVIRGAFDLGGWKFDPQPPSGGPFVIGRLSRPDADKWSDRHWRVLESVPYRQRRAIAMGFNDKTLAKCGPPPKWAETLKPQAISVHEFFKRCHAMIGLNGGARENWPRVGLEAMATGVPLVVQDSWGWKEMVDHGKTGFRASTDQEFAFYLAKLAYEPETYTRIAEAAHAALVEFSDPLRLAGEWYEVFRAVAAKKPAAAPTPTPVEVSEESVPIRRGPEAADYRPPKICCQCVTYNRPDQIRDAIECFERQTYPLDRRELVILDDAGQYGDQSGPGWRIVSFDRRFRTLGEKRNACVALASPDAGCVAVWDDDDIYLPWHLEELARGFTGGARFIRPANIYTLTGQENTLARKAANGLFHGAWGFTREAFDAAGGYPFIQSGQDQGLTRRMKDVGIDTWTETERPSYIYRWCSHGGPPHLSAMGPRGYEQRGEETIQSVAAIEPAWSRDWITMAGEQEEVAA